MNLIAYGLYALLLIAAIWRIRSAPECRTAAAAAALMPVLTAAVLTWYALDTQNGAVAVLSTLAAGAWLFAVSLPFTFIPLSTPTRQAARITGWSLIAAVTLIPATTLLLAPFAGALAFPALDVLLEQDRKRRA